MKNITQQELKNILKLESNQCFNTIVETDNEIKILKSKYSGSSITETREMMNIHSILNQYKEYLEIIPKGADIILKFK